MIGKRRKDSERNAAPSIAWIGLAIITVAGCAGEERPIALQNNVFYLAAEAKHSQAAAKERFERPYPSLNQAASTTLPAYDGISLFDGVINLSRPAQWKIRRASNEPEGRFIEYISPHEYIVGIYERLESPQDPWRSIFERYEEDVQKSAAQLLSRPVPIAVGNVQGRAYTVRRTIPGAKEPFINQSREYLLRSDRRIVLLQIVHQGETLTPLSNELMHVIQTLEVL